MPDITPEQEEKLKRIVAQMGSLLVARKDVKAVEVRMGQSTGWIPDRERVPRGVDASEGALLPMRMQDFREHIFGKRCIGTYLLNQDSMVKFIAFDIDLKSKGAQYLVVRDLDDISKLTAGKSAQEASAILDLDLKHGNLEESLHRPDLDPHRWARIILSQTTMIVTQAVMKVLGLKTLEVVTGGGTHVIVPFGDMIPAAEARVAAREVMDSIGMVPTKGDNFFGAPRNPDFGIEVEVFPKQDTNNGFGNLIRLPLGWHMNTQRRTYFLDRSKMVNAWDLPKGDPEEMMGRCSEHRA
jgi:hypothetical protein